MALNDSTSLPSVAQTDPQTGTTLASAVEHGKRAFALRKYEEAVDHYATALELVTKEHGDDAPETADLYFAYGKALLENAIAQAGVLGKEQTDANDDAFEEPKASGSGLGDSGPILSFSGDADDVPLGEEQDVAVDLFAQNAFEDEEDEGAEREGGEDEAEPEDDFNAAWEVLDLARAIYEKDKDNDDEVKLKLADTYITLGDVSLETEKFDQAISDYTAALSLKTELLPLSSRQIAEAHYKLGIVLDLTSGRLADAIEHSQMALESIETRLAELRNALSGQSAPPPDPPKNTSNGKGKSKGGQLTTENSVQSMTKSQIEDEIKEMEGLREDLALKVEELKTAPNESRPSAPALVAQALDKELNAGVSSSTSQTSTIVNDLTSKVVKKKKPDANGIKRKAEDSLDAPQHDKRARSQES